MMFFQSACFAGTKEDIASLLSVIEQSGCTFVRNGKQYDSLEARRHIEKKYTFYKNKKQIATAEDFIRYSATKSSSTGRPYRVLCDGADMASADWLSAELDKLRSP
jgi:hypothetical protein